MVQSEHGIADGLASLRPGCQRDAPAAIDAVRRAFISLPHVIGRPVDPQRADRTGDVAHVMPPHQPAPVADPRRMAVARGEQQPRRLEGAGRQHEARRGNAEPVAVERLDHRMPDAPAIVRCNQPRAVCMQQYPHRLCGGEAVAIAPPEIRRATEPLDALGGEVGRREVPQQGAHAAGNGALCVVGAVAGLAHRIGARIVGCHGVVPDGPAAMGNPGPRLEVDRIERDAAAAPDGRRTAEAPLPVFVRRTVQRGVRDLARVERLRRGLFCGAAGLEQHDPEAGPEQFECQRDARGAGSEDAEIGLDRRSAHDGPGVADHGLAPPNATVAPTCPTRADAPVTAPTPPNDRRRSMPRAPGGNSTSAPFRRSPGPAADAWHRASPRSWRR